MLRKQTLETEIRKINDSEFEEFSGWKGSYSEYCLMWSNAVMIYGKEVKPTSITFEQAKLAMYNRLLAGGGDIRNRVFENSVKQFAVVLATGMAPIYTGVPPTAYLDLRPIFNFGLNGGSAQEISKRMSQIIHDWFKTGTAINNNSGVIKKWT